MGKFSDVLLTVDFDRTLTGPDAKIPQRNIEAIESFMAEGGAFTVNTGRSVATFWKHLETIPVNAPFLLYNGSAAWENGELKHCVEIDLPVWQTMETVKQLFPTLNLEIQGNKVHYLVHTTQAMIDLYENLQWRYVCPDWGQAVGPFMKFSLFGQPNKPEVADMFDADRDDVALFDEAEAKLRELYGDKAEIFRAAPRIIDVHAKGVSKINAARKLQKTLDRKVLVCVGDAENDIPMLDGADYAYCPADGVVAARYETVCPCGEGAVADVIYKKIPEILAKQP